MRVFLLRYNTTMIKDILTIRLISALSTLDLPHADIHLEHPAEESHGDYSSNVAMQLFSNIKNPRDLAQTIVTELQEDKELKNIISKIEIAGPGFINFWISDDYLMSFLNQIADHSITFPVYHLGTHKRAIIEYAHFNTHKAVHIGHMRNIAIGESISRIYEALDNQIVRLSYGGDVGMHIAKCLYGLQRLNESPATLSEQTSLLAKAYTQGNNAYEDDEKAKDEIIKINKQIYQKDPVIFPLWEKTRQWSFDQFEQIYKRMYTTFDRCYYESDVSARGLEMSKQALERGILEESDGAVVFNGDKYGLDTRVFITGEGNPTYEGKELGIAEIEITKHGKIDKIIHVVAAEQKSFFEVTFKVEELIDPRLYSGKQYHFIYGYVRLLSGKMSSRKGTIIKGEWLLDEAKGRIQKSYPEMSNETAEVLAVASVKYAFLKIDARQDISFDFDQSVSLEGNSGPYLLYTYARCKSVLKRSKDSKIQRSKLQITNYKLQKEELAILRTLYKYPEIVYEAGKNYAPNLIANYLYDLAQKYNLFYQKVSILKAQNSILKTQRLAITQATSQILKNGLNLLGIETVETM